jgi:hydroxyethylthiazole kinase-like uncharacterized protein yjeF
MTELLTAAQMRAIEQAAIASGEVTGLELMERAGAGVVEAILEEWPDMAKTPQKAVVLCGPGNNGGDGFVVARLLKQRGWAVDVFLYGEVEKLPPDAKVNAERWLELGEVQHLNKEEVEQRGDEHLIFPHVNIWVDAIFGTGLSRAISSDLSEVLLEIESQIDFGLRDDEDFYVAVDISSGYCSDSGRSLYRNAEPHSEYFLPPLSSDLTITFHGKKVGHFLSSSSMASEKVVVKDIGLQVVPKGVAKHDKTIVTLLDSSTQGTIAAMKGRFLYQSHKFDYGHALILSGPSAHTGAARLAARGALRIGAGVVSLGAPQAAIAECAAQVTAIMLAPIEDGVALAATLQDKRINALCLGPALGLEGRAEGLLEVALGGVEPHPTVLDADALTILARRPDLFAKLHKNCVLTPHAGEFKRLFPDIMAKLEAPATTGPAYSKVDATREAAARAGCVVLFKGADTVIADPSGRAAINSAHYERAAPWLATAGAGDVLAGFITGLLARGFAPMQAAETAAWLHVECALKFGPGLIAEDIPEQLPAVFRDLAL